MIRSYYVFIVLILILVVTSVIPFYASAIMPADGIVVTPKKNNLRILLRIPITPIRVIDGDTIECKAEFKFHLRTSNYSAPEINTKTGIEYKKKLISLINNGKTFEVEITADPDNLGKVMSFERVLGVLYIDGRPIVLESPQKRSKK